jgi:hypothetical protein
MPMNLFRTERRRMSEHYFALVAMKVLVKRWDLVKAEYK